MPRNKFRGFEKTPSRRRQIESDGIIFFSCRFNTVFISLGIYSVALYSVASLLNELITPKQDAAKQDVG